MHAFITRSGTKWTVQNGRITRGTAPTFGVPFEIVNEPFEWLVRPATGQRASLRIKSNGEVVHTAPIEGFLILGDDRYPSQDMNPFQGDYHDFLVENANQEPLA